MKRRQFFKTIGMGLGGAVASLLPTQKSESVVLGADVAAPGPGPVTQTPDDLGGYLVPPEFQERIIQAAKNMESITHTHLARSKNGGPLLRELVGQTNEKKATYDAFAEYLKGQVTPPGKGMYYQVGRLREDLT